MSESSYNLRPRVKTRSRSETRSALSHEPSPVTRSAVARTILTGEKRPVPGQHPVPEVVGSVVAPLPGPEMWSRQVFSRIIRLATSYASVKRSDCTDRQLNEEIVPTTENTNILSERPSSFASLSERRRNRTKSNQFKVVRTKTKKTERVRISAEAR